ncbi:MAG: HD domain-containing protein [Pseudomonadota bacterium]
MSNDSLNKNNVVDFLEDIFTRRGGEEYLGEPVTMAEHMLQAAHFAAQDDEAEIVVVAALLHDIGHFTSEFGTFSMTDTHDRYHENAGAKVLEAFFPPLVVACVRQHVAAKRYLCAARPEYRHELSEASIHSLNLQGGPLSPDAVAAFERQPYFSQILTVRACDDRGKQAGLKTPGFSHYMPLLKKAVSAHCGS